MKKGLFTGWRQVFSFTFHDATSSKSFRRATGFIAIGFFLLIVGVLIFTAISQNNPDETKVKMTKVYVYNDTEYKYLDFSNFASVEKGKYKSVKFEVSQEEMSKKQKELSDTEAILQMKKKDQGVTLQLLLSSDSSCSEGADDFLDGAVMYVKQCNIANSGVEAGKLQVILAPVESQFSHEGTEPESLGVTLTKLFVPMVLIMMAYFMIIVYGQSIAKSVSSEKTSKLVESLLLSVRPYALIAGKILAMSLVGILQFLIWVLSIVLGLIGGHYIGLAVNSNYVDPVTSIIQSLQKLNVGTGLTVPSVILGIIAFLLGFVLFCVLAGLVSSRVQRTEDLAASMGVFQVVVVICFFATYFSELGNQTDILNIARWVPFSSAFILPSDLILGNVSLLVGGIQMALLVVALVILIVITGRFYRNQLFNKK